MRYRRFGKTEMLLSVFSLGAMRYMGSADNAHQTILRALEVGINHIETAEGYGKSEEFIGQAMRNGLSAQRDRLYLTTKISPTKDADSMRRQIEQSLKKLNVDYIDNFDIHGINLKEHLDLVTNPNGCMKAVREAAKTERQSILTADQLKKMEKMKKDDNGKMKHRKDKK